MQGKSTNTSAAFELHDTKEITVFGNKGPADAKNQLYQSKFNKRLGPIKGQHGLMSP
jgi:hypothetical protein